MDTAFILRLQQTADRISEHLDGVLSVLSQNVANTPQRLVDAMRHGVLNGGKRIRPFLLIESAALFGVSETQSMQIACALECVHCYSLIHDDLPAMDDDDMRRGQPTVHKVFDEATAILAGDALLTLAFELIADRGKRAGPEICSELVILMAKASGRVGMIGGQMFDIEAQTGAADEQQIRLLQSMKTGALIRFACEAGATIGEANAKQRVNLIRYGEKIGLAFQLADDLLDVTSDFEVLGKAVQKDHAMGKGTLVGMFGIDKSRALLAAAIEDAISCLETFGSRANVLRDTARFVSERTN